MPKPLNLRLGPRKRPARIPGDMIDFVNEEPEIHFDGLDGDEKDCCLLCADLVCAAVFLLASFLFP